MCVSVCNVVSQECVSLQQPQEKQLLEQPQKRHTAGRTKDFQPHVVWNRCTSPTCRYSLWHTSVDVKNTFTSWNPQTEPLVEWLSCRFTAIGFVFLLSRDDAAELQTTARCTVLFLPEGEASRRIWSEPTEPAKPRLRVSDAAELSIMLKNTVNPFRWSYTIYICDFSFFFKSMKVIRIHPHPWISVPNVHPIVVGFTIWPNVFWHANVIPINETMGINALLITASTLLGRLSTSFWNLAAGFAPI